MSILKKAAIPLLVAAAATTALIAPAASASADEFPTYACNHVFPVADGPDLQWAGEDCYVAVGDLPDFGPVIGPFIIADRFTGFRVFCEPRDPSGIAALPYRVDGRRCHPIDPA